MVIFDALDALALVEVILVVEILDYSDSIFVAGVGSHLGWWTGVQELFSSLLLPPGVLPFILFSSIIFSGLSVLVSKFELFHSVVDSVAGVGGVVD